MSNHTFQYPKVVPVPRPAADASTSGAKPAAAPGARAA